MTTRKIRDFPTDPSDYLDGRIDVDGNGCWNWLGAKAAGYGALTFNQKTYRAHRFVFQIRYGREPNGMLLHSCDNRACVNPDHLREGTHLENMRDARERGGHKRGSKKYGAKLNEEAVKVLRFLHSRGYSYGRLAKAYDMNYWTIRTAIKLEWKHVETF